MKPLYLLSKRVLVIMALVLSLLASTVQAAQAGSPIVWNGHGSYVPMHYGTRSSAGVKIWMRNSTHFYMRCYVDDQWYKGNYWTNRWFFGQHSSGHYGYVNASWVYYQTSVPRC